MEDYQNISSILSLFEEYEKTKIELYNIKKELEKLKN